MKHFLLYAFVLVLAAAPVYADDWPQFLGPRRDGSSHEKGLLDAFGKDGPKVVWQRDVGEGYSGPIIAGDNLILFHRVGAEEVVECLHAVTAKPIWNFAYPTKYKDALSKGNGPRSTPLIAGDKVIALGAEGTLTCLTLSDGKKLWSRSLTKEYKTPLGYFGIGTSPVVEQNLVLINVGAPKAGIVAFDLGDGKEAWRATEDKPSDYLPSYSSPVVCTVDGVRLAVFFTRTGVVVVDPKTGAIRHQQRWRARNDASVNAAVPLVMGNLAFFSSSYETGALLLKLRKDGADEVWNDDNVMSNHYNTCVHSDGHLFGFEGRQEVGPSLRCVELKTKKVKWDKADFGAGTMIFADGRLIILTESGDLCVVNASSAAFRETARFRLLDAGPCRAQIALANGRLYARDQKKLVCVQMTK
jgi:outer membrane protein assembly factor BamB